MVNKIETTQQFIVTQRMWRKFRNWEKTLEKKLPYSQKPELMKAELDAIRSQKNELWKLMEDYRTKSKT